MSISGRLALVPNSFFIHWPIRAFAETAVIMKDLNRGDRPVSIGHIALGYGVFMMIF